MRFWIIAGRFPSGSAGRQQSGAAGRFQGGNGTLRDKKTSLSKKKEALLKYELYAVNSELFIYYHVNNSCSRIL